MKWVLVSLFAGMGGFDVAADALGIATAVQCEYDVDCQAVLRHHWPAAYLHGDIHTLTGKIILDEIQKRHGARYNRDGSQRYRILVVGGFPCQPFSAAGKRKGTDDHRYLWPEAIRVAIECGADAVVYENVAGLVSMVEPLGDSILEGEVARSAGFGDLFSESESVEIEIEQRRILGTICDDLEAAGLEPPRLASGEPIILNIPACAIGARHRRDRLWIVAYAKIGGIGGSGRSSKLDGSGRGNEESEQVGGCIRNYDAANGKEWNAPVPKGKRRGKAGEGVTTNSGSGINASEQRVAGAGCERVASDAESGRRGGLRNKEKEARAREGYQLLGGLRRLSPQRPSRDGVGADADGKRLRRQGDGTRIAGFSGEPRKGHEWHYVQTEPPLCDGVDGLSARLGGVRVPSTGRPMTYNQLNKMGLKMGGNSIQPQVAMEVMWALIGALDNETAEALDGFNSETK